MGYGAKDPRIREAAQKYLDEAARKKEQEQMSQVLLRASSDRDTAPDILLRPAQESLSADPQQLLRGSDAERSV